jgi:hypothetical protein
MTSAKKLALAGLMLALALLACTLPDVGPTPVPALTPKSVDPDLIPQQTETLTDQTEGDLPHTIYFLSDTTENIFQVWRLESSNYTSYQVTYESTDILDYTVSPVDGSVAYVVGNQLYWVDANGENRQLLVEGGPEENSDEFRYRRKLSSPRFSPDGSTLAFAQDGINLYAFDTGEVRKVVANMVEQADNGPIVPSNIYSPEMWTADPNKLLVNVGFLEGGTLAMLDLNTGEITRLGEGIVCCHPAISVDGNSVYVGSPILGMIDSGLWRYDTASGAGSVLLPSQSGDETYNFVGWPVQLPSGELQYFYNNLPAFPTGEVPLTLVRSAADGVTNRVQLRSDLLQIREVLWAEDGSLALVVQVPLGETSTTQAGTVVLLTLDSNPIRPIIANAYNLNWGP